MFVGFKKIINSWNPMFDKTESFKNTEAINERGGYINPLFPATNFSYRMLKTIKKFYLGKFKYEGDIEKIGLENLFLIDEYLFQWGRVCVIKLDNQWLVGNFVVVKRDFNAKPVKIKFLPLLETERKMKNKRDKPKPLKQTIKAGNKSITKDLIFTVGKDAVIIKNGPSEYSNQQRQAFTSFFVILSFLGDLDKVYNQLMNNVVVARTVLGVSGNLSKKVEAKIRQAVLNGDVIAKLGDSDGDAANVVNEGKPWDFRDRSNELIDQYNFIWEKILNELGGDTNANNMKRERQTPDEIDVNNDFTDKINYTELAYRNLGMDHLEKTFGVKIRCVLNEPEEKEGEEDGKDEENN